MILCGNPRAKYLAHEAEIECAATGDPLLLIYPEHAEADAQQVVEAVL